VEEVNLEVNVSERLVSYNRLPVRNEIRFKMKEPAPKEKKLSSTKVKRRNVFLANRRHRELIKRDDVSAFLPVTNNRGYDVGVDKISWTVSACSFATFYLPKPYLSRHKTSTKFAFALKVVHIRYLYIPIVYRRVIKRKRGFDVNKKKKREKAFTVIRFS